MDVCEDGISILAELVHRCRTVDSQGMWDVGTKGLKSDMVDGDEA